MDEPFFEFFRDNIVLIGVVVLAVFWYLIVMVRKRKNQGFTHPRNKP
jgi:hypothetical protein